LTCRGEVFAGRVGASLLNGIGLPELVTANLDEYVGVAIRLAVNPEKLAEVGQRLARHRLSAPLFDTKLFARNIEAAYRAMLRRYRTGLPPDHIAIA
jgi:predicted O-linked N-acetylglucosamine transferase (SPINDLY family)